MAKVDFDKASTGFIVVPTGSYLVKIQGYEKKPSKTSGVDMLVWKGVIMQGDQEGVTVSDFTSLSDKAVWRVANLIKTAGVNVSGVIDTEGPLFKKFCNAAIGQTMFWNIEKTVNDQGQDTNKVRGYAPDQDCQPVDVSVDSPDEIPDFLKGQ